MGAIWEYEHSVNVAANRASAWRFWTEVENWPVVDPAVEWVRLDGPFAADTNGETKPVGQNPTSWTLTEVNDESRAVIMIEIPGAAVYFTWKFENLEGGGTRIRQQVGLEGRDARAYLDGMRELEKGIPAGMRKLAAAIDRTSGT